MSEASEKAKKDLANSANQYLNELKINLDTLSKSLSNSGSKLAVIGGSLLAGYLLYKLISKEEKSVSKIKKSNTDDYVEIREVRPNTPTVLEKMVVKAMEEGLLLLLNIAKQKLLEYLESKHAEPKNTQ